MRRKYFVGVAVTASLLIAGGAGFADAATGPAPVPAPPCVTVSPEATVSEAPTTVHTTTQTPSPSVTTSPGVPGPASPTVSPEPTSGVMTCAPSGDGAPQIRVRPNGAPETGGGAMAAEVATWTVGVRG